MVSEVRSNVPGPWSDDIQWAAFMARMKSVAGVDLSAYKPEQMHRRLRSLMTRMGAQDWAQFANLLQHDPQRLKEFKDYFTINVSEFFRGADKFLYLQDAVIPELARGRPRLNIWSAGCSVGAESYTLAMIAHKLGLSSRTAVLGTDIDETALRRAAEGDRYADAEVREVPQPYLDYLNRSEEGWAVKPEVRSLVEFRPHNLLTDPYPAGTDLIVCRNVVIYFTDAAKQKIYTGFFNSLTPGGYLFVGGTEIVARAREMGFESPKVYFYRKPS